MERKDNTSAEEISDDVKQTRTQRLCLKCFDVMQMNGQSLDKSLSHSGWAAHNSPTVLDEAVRSFLKLFTKYLKYTLSKTAQMSDPFKPATAARISCFILCLWSSLQTQNTIKGNLLWGFSTKWKLKNIQRQRQLFGWEADLLWIYELSNTQRCPGDQYLLLQCDVICSSEDLLHRVQHFQIQVWTK